jgi:hypothetical protein
VKGEHMLTVERTFQGAWRVSAIIGDHLETRQFMGYAKQEAVNRFRAEFNLAPLAPKPFFVSVPSGAYAWRCERGDVVALGDTKQEARENWQEAWIKENS